MHIQLKNYQILSDPTKQIPFQTIKSTNTSHSDGFSNKNVKLNIIAEFIMPLKFMSDILAESNFILPSENNYSLSNQTQSQEALFSHLGIPLNFFVDAQLNQGSPNRVERADHMK